MMKNGLKSGGGDPRVRYTRKVLKDSLLELMKERPVAAIGIKEICARAEVSRSTFYTYYDDVYHLLDEINEEVLNQFECMANQYIPQIKNSGKATEEMHQKVLHYIAENSNSLQILLSENGDMNFQKKFFKKSIGYSRKLLREKSNPIEDAHISEAYSVFFTSGAIGLIHYWIKNNMHIPIPKLAKMFVKLTAAM
ncbi:MAG: TetR/AcrR family transcriptional regulator [Spirochaetaceae bacterium]|jgi:AcrR family transcriptional regulator|nr:TetR/AcrR family transcriptional regulator [Spirochaetaceae bacterium]